MSALTTYTFDELFFPLEKGVSKLTSYAVYRSLDYKGDLVPMWGGNNEHRTENLYVSVNAKNKDNKPIRIFEGPCLIISLDGSAGSMTYKDKGVRFALNHHAGVLKVRDASILNLEYFKYRFENFLKNLSVSDGSKTLSKKLLEKQAFELPSLKEQEAILGRYKALDLTKQKLEKYQKELAKLQTQMLEVPNIETDKVPLTTMFSVNQGHQITDLELYSSDGDIPVYTGNNEIKGRWDKTIVDKEDLPCLSYPSKANSGVVYVQDKMFDANNTALLIPRDEWRERLHLDWFRLKLPPIFLDLMTSKEGVSYLNKEIVEGITIDLPIKEKQIEQATYFSKIEKIKDAMKPLGEKIDSLLSKQVMVE